MPAMDITLAPELAKIVEQKVADGEYDSASDVVNQALLLWLEEQRAEEEELRREIAIGLEEAERGECKTYTAESLAAWRDEIKARLRQRHAERAKAPA